MIFPVDDKNQGITFMLDGSEKNEKKVVKNHLVSGKIDENRKILGFSFCANLSQQHFGDHVA